VNEWWEGIEAYILTGIKTEYNQLRRHSALGYQTPACYAHR